MQNSADFRHPANFPKAPAASMQLPGLLHEQSIERDESAQDCFEDTAHVDGLELHFVTNLCAFAPGRTNCSGASFYAVDRDGIFLK